MILRLILDMFDCNLESARNNLGRTFKIRVSDAACTVVSVWGSICRVGVRIRACRAEEEGFTVG